MTNLPRTNYVPACESQEYQVRTPREPWVEKGNGLEIFSSYISIRILNLYSLITNYKEIWNECWKDEFNNNENQTFFQQIGWADIQPTEWEHKEFKDINWLEHQLEAGTEIIRTVMDDTLPPAEGSPNGPQEKNIIYVAPFDKCDRETDYKLAWAVFEKRFTEESK